MKKKIKDELHGLKASELVKKAAEIRKQITTERMNMMTKEVKNRRIVKELRRKLAVLLSIERMKALVEGK